MFLYIKSLSIIFVSLFLFTACSQKELSQKPTIIEVQEYDILNLSSKVEDNIFNEDDSFEVFLNRYFKPWKQTKVSYPKKITILMLKSSLINK